MSQAQAVEVGFFQAMRDLGLSLKVAARLYDDTVELMVKSAAVRMPALGIPRASSSRIDIHSGPIHPVSGMVDTLGKPGFEKYRAFREGTPSPSGAPVKFRHSVTGMPDDLRPASLASRASQGAQNKFSNAVKAINKHPSKAGIGATVLGTTGAAAVGTGTGLLGSKVLNLLRGDNAARN